MNYMENRYDNQVPRDMSGALIQGTVVGQPFIDHELYGEKFYEFKMELKRNSGISDMISVVASERILWQTFPQEGTRLYIEGDIRTASNIDEVGRSHLRIYMFAKRVEQARFEEDINDIKVVGTIVKPIVYRKTPFGRDIADLLIAVNRSYGKSSYIPCIAWGRNAVWVTSLTVGTKLILEGRFQSRGYKKTVDEEGTVEDRVAYELSISSITMI